MKLSFFTGSMSMYPLEKSFELAAECGFEGIEICGIRPHAYAPDLKNGDIVNLMKLSKDYKMPIIGFEPYQAPHPYNIMYERADWRKESIEYFKTALEMTAAMGAGNFMVMAPGHPGFGRDVDDKWKMMIDGLTELAEHAEKVNATIVLETVTPWESSMIITSDDIVRTRRAVNSPNVKGMLDLVAAITNAEPPSEYFEKLGKDMHHLHLVDGHIDGEDHLMAGDGDMPFREILEMIEGYGYEGYCSLEHFEEYRMDPILFNKKAVRMIRELQAEIAADK
ncbi:TIM barrel protein [Youxingia wuxianensis]|uniref:TIM barrel protein n=1 Tax=Youxingia wuxianensis TaxID=2763678 RepID=A0A926IIR9_9FIRM|nr:TIM barrel protein [Youxingia wuxianensis]MBC8586485.1 TIM barrel protein [Youxingia wuxianensis]